MRAVVLARGLARRMRAEDATAPLASAQARAAAAGLKAMMPVGDPGSGGDGRPFLDFVLGSLAEAGFGDTALVIGPEHEDIRRRYGAEVPAERLRIAFVVQREARGTADAVLCCRDWAGLDPFVVVNADNLYPVDVLRALAGLEEPGVAGFRRDELVSTSGFPPDRVAAFALLEVGTDGCLAGIREKPGAAAVASAGPEALVSMNCWRFDQRIFSACREVPASERGELELPLAVGLAVSRGVCFRVLRARGAVLDLSRRGDVARVSERLAGLEPTW